MSLENAVKENDTYALQANYHPQHIHIRNEINHAFIHSFTSNQLGWFLVVNENFCVLFTLLFLAGRPTEGPRKYAPWTFRGF